MYNMELNTDKLDTLLETALDNGNLEELMEFLCASGDEEYLNFVINEIGNNIKEILSTSPDSQFKITNILNIILGLAEIALFGPEKSEYLTRCLLNIAVDKCCSIFNLKHVLTMLKTFFSDDHILEWGSSDESLFVPIKQLGVKLIDIGDYECQSILLETLWQISEADRNFWAQMWFSQEKPALMFLNLNPEKFVLECRKFLNYINRNGANQRTFAFVATSVSLGSFQLRKPYGSEFWVDFNHDTQSISFFCSSLNQENEQTWETVFISSENVEGYCIQNQNSKTTKELLITLNCSCSQLLSLEDTSIAQLESQIIQMTFWSFLDIQYHADALFKRNVPYLVEENFNSKSFKRARRASEPKEIVCSSDYQEQMAASKNSKPRRPSEPIEILRTSNSESAVSSWKCNKHERASESTELICPPDPQEMIDKLHIRKRRRVSESSHLIPAVDRQEGDTACVIYADEDNGPNHIEHLQCEDSPKQQQKCSSTLIDLLEENQNLYSGSKINSNDYEKDDDRQVFHSSLENQKKSSEQPSSQSRSKGSENLSNKTSTQVSIARNRQGAKKSQNAELLAVPSVPQRKSSQVSIARSGLDAKKRSQNAELLAVSIVSPRKSSQVFIERSVPTTEVRSQKAELLAVSRISQGNSSQMNSNKNALSTSKRNQNAQLLEDFFDSPRKSSQASLERHLQSTPNRSQSSNQRNSPGLSPVLAVAEHYIQENVTPRHVSNNNLHTEELNGFKMDVESTDYQSNLNKKHDTNMTVKRHGQSIHNKKSQENRSRQENSTELFDGEEPQIITVHSPERKSRKAAVNARKRNKLILEQKGSETSFEGTQQINQQNRADGLSQETEEYDVNDLLPSNKKVLTAHKRKMLDRDQNEDMLENNASKSLKRSKTMKKTDKNWENFDEDEYVFRTPPPLVKRRKRKRSIFCTDTETGSSEVSWLNKFSLFETPKKSYSNRKKTNESKKKKTVKQRPKRSKKPIIMSPSIAQRSKASDSESRSKSAFSEFNLVIEKEKIPLPSAELSGLFRSIKRNSRHSSTIEDNFQTDNQEVELDGFYEKENSIQLCNNDNISCVSENLASNGGLKKSSNSKQQIFRPSTSWSSTVEPEVLSKNEKSMKSSNVSHKNSKEGNMSKKRLANTIISEPIIKKSRNVAHSISNDYNSIPIIKGQAKKQKTNICQGSERNVINSVTNTVSNDTQNVQIALETVVKVSPFKRNKAVTSKRWISPNNILESSGEQYNLEGLNTLTEKSLNEIGDKTNGKRLHLDYFFESLSSLSPIPQTAEKTEIAEDISTLEKSKSNPIIEKPLKEGVLHYSISGEKIAKGRLKRPKQHKADLPQDLKDVSSSLQSKSVHQIEEKHFEQDILNHEPSERSIQASSAMFQKDPSKEKMSCEYHLPTKTSVLHILSDEVNNLTFRLFCTLKKCMSDFRQKMVALRESIVNTADSILANESKFTEKDLQSLARNCKESRLHIQKHLRKLYAMGNEYFESEKRLEKRLSKKNKKAVIKYTKSLQVAQSIAEKALEERFLLKSKAFLKSFLKKMELV